jgi:hypothetical protein
MKAIKKHTLISAGPIAVHGDYHIYGPIKDAVVCITVALGTGIFRRWHN